MEYRRVVLGPRLVGRRVISGKEIVETTMQQLERTDGRMPCADMEERGAVVVATMRKTTEEQIRAD